MTTLSVYKIEDGPETHHVIAGSKEEATTIAREHDFTEDEADCSVVRLAGDHPLTIRDDDDIRQTLTCAEWVAKTGAGFLCSTVY